MDPASEPMGPDADASEPMGPDVGLSGCTALVDGDSGCPACGLVEGEADGAVTGRALGGAVGLTTISVDTTLGGCVGRTDCVETTLGGSVDGLATGSEFGETLMLVK